jgi:hypothetical protein
LPRRVIYDCDESLLVPDYYSGPTFDGRFESGNLRRVREIGDNAFDLQIAPDPNARGSAQWFFFRADGLTPGNYRFRISGFARRDNCHERGSQIVARRGSGGWFRFGTRMRWSGSRRKRWSLRFEFTVAEPGTMWFAQTYPYTLSDLRDFEESCEFPRTTLVTSLGGLELPVIFWDADVGRFAPVGPLLRLGAEPSARPGVFGRCTLETIRRWRQPDAAPIELDPNVPKPAIVILARTHPGEPCSSFGLEGFLDSIFRGAYRELTQYFSFLIIPMMNPDGVVAGLYRPTLEGDDQNRIWENPSESSHPEAHAALLAAYGLAATREIAFFLDFHGHTSALGCFTFGYGNTHDASLCSGEALFPEAMARNCAFWNQDLASYERQEEYDGTVRVAFRERFRTVFTYTLEMSFGGWGGTQFTPAEYRGIGETTAASIREIFLGEPLPPAEPEAPSPDRTRRKWNVEV